MTVVVLLVVAVLLALTGAATAATISRRKRAAGASQVVPEVDSRPDAEEGWAGAHSPEARLHRRRRDAVTALRSDPALDQAGLFESRIVLEQEALALDERLVAVAALPEGARTEPLAEIAVAVDALEAAAASLASSGPELGAATRLDEVVVDVAERVAPSAETPHEPDPETEQDSTGDVAQGEMPPVDRPDAG